MLEVDLFVEDRAHELIAGPLVGRLLREEGVPARVRVRTAVGGHPRALSELRNYQRAVSRGLLGLTRPDLVVVVIDANCCGLVEARNAVKQEVDEAAAGHTVIACPDPHVERWMSWQVPGI